MTRQLEGMRPALNWNVAEGKEEDKIIILLLLKKVMIPYFYFCFSSHSRRPFCGVCRRTRTRHFIGSNVINVSPGAEQ